MTVVFSGNEITDATRALNVEGDGLPPGSGTGIYRASANLLPNGGFENDAIGWNAIGSATFARTIDGTAKFGDASCRVVTAADGDGIESYPSVAVTPSLPYAASGWVYLKAGGTVRVLLSERDAGDAELGVSTSPVLYSTVDTWLRLYIVRNLGAAAAFARVRAVAADNSELLLDGMQLEQNKIASPYIETNGAPASRGPARIQIPAKLIDLRQGWFGVRYRYGYPSADDDTTLRYLLLFGDDINDRLEFYLNLLAPGGGSYIAQITNSGTLSAGSVVTPPWLAGTAVTMLMRWVYAAGVMTVGASLNGGSFAAQSPSPMPLPAYAEALADVGSAGITDGVNTALVSDRQLNGNIAWAVISNAAITDANAATIYALGDTPPTAARFPRAGQLVVL